MTLAASTEDPTKDCGPDGEVVGALRRVTLHVPALVRRFLGSLTPNHNFHITRSSC